MSNVPGSSDSISLTLPAPAVSLYPHSRNAGVAGPSLAVQPHRAVLGRSLSLRHSLRQRWPDPRPHADGDHSRGVGPIGDPSNHDIAQLRAHGTTGRRSLDMHAVSKAVNYVKNNGPELLEPVPVEE